MSTTTCKRGLTVVRDSNRAVREEGRSKQTAPGNQSGTPGLNSSDSSVMQTQSVSSVLFVATYSLSEASGVGQFMIDVGTRLLGQGIRVGMCYRRAEQEFPLPERIAAAKRIEVSVMRNRKIRTAQLLWRTMFRILAA